MSTRESDLERHATCSCGQLGISVAGQPVRVSVCHCLACQRRTGSVFAAQARFPRENTGIHGESNVYSRTGDSGESISFHFCPRCGSTVYYYFDSDPDIIAVPVGAFADPGCPAPEGSVYELRRHAWVTMPPGVDRLD